MNKQKQIKITIPNELQFLESVLDSARNAAQLLGFQDKAMREITMGIEEVLTDIISNAFDPGQESSINIHFNLKLTGLEVKIKEKGIPFDPSLDRHSSPNEGKKSQAINGLGAYLDKGLMDEFSFHNLGKQGKETCLFKYLDQKKVDSILSRQELQDQQAQSETEKLPHQSVHYSVRLLKEEEAIEVAKCVYAAYGYTYLHEDMYYPERVRALNKTGNLLSFVAVKDDAEVIAHAGLLMHEDPLIPESGVAVTKPKYRGQGCLNALSQVRIEEARKRGFLGIYGLAVTTHYFSQKSELKHGFKPCALLLSTAREPEYKDINKKDIQRESAVLQFTYLNTPQNIPIFPPEKHADFIRSIYCNLGVTPEIGSVKEHPGPAEQKANISVKTDAEKLIADITVYKFGKNIIEQLTAKLASIRPQAIKTIYLYLPLMDKNTAIYTASFEELGFFFAGIKPGSQQGDFLILQHLNEYCINYDQIATACEFSESLKEYVRKNDVSTHAF